MVATLTANQPKLVSDEELLTDLRILEAGIQVAGPHVTDFTSRG